MDGGAGHQVVNNLTPLVNAAHITKATTLRTSQAGS
jgi:hypothetical protein